MKKKLAAILLIILLFASHITGYAENTEENTGTIEPADTTVSSSTDLIDEELLNTWMEGYLSDHGLTGDRQDFSVGFCYTATGDSWYYNADTWMYSASLYKVPVSMLVAEKVAAGELTQESIIMGTTVEYLESTALVYSNNTSGHNMVDYLGGTYLGKCSDMTIAYTDLSDDYFDQNFYDLSYYTARYMTQVMKTLYDNPERFPHVMEFLLQALPDDYYNRTLGDSYEVAQKYGAYEEPNGNKNNHCSAVIYTPTPIIVTVMTRNVDDFQARIAEVGSYLAEYSITLDARAEQLRLEEEARMAAEAAAALASNESSDSGDSSLPTENAGSDGGAAGFGKAQPDDTPQSAIRLPMILLGIAGLILVLILILLVLEHRNSKTPVMPAPQDRQAHPKSTQRPPSEKQAAVPPANSKYDPAKPTDKNRYTPRH